MLSNYARRKAKELNNLASYGFINGYSMDRTKERWLSAGKSVLRAMAKEMNLSEWKVYTIRGGPAVSGDICLLGVWREGKGIYVSMGSPRLYKWTGDPEFMYRYSPGMTYDGHGRNRWMLYKDLADDLDWVCKKMVSDILQGPNK